MNEDMHRWVREAKEWKPMEPCKELKKAIEAVKLHREPGHPIPGRIVRAYAQKFGVDPDLIMLPFINEEPVYDGTNEDECEAWDNRH